MAVCNIEYCEIEHIQSWGKLIPMYFEILLSNSRPCQVSVGCAIALQRQYFTVSSNKELILATFRVGLSLLRAGKVDFHFILDTF